jgi:hypothetical protein
MSHVFKVFAREGRFTSTLHGSPMPNRVSEMLSKLSSGLLVPHQRCNVRLAAPSAGRTRYALTLTENRIWMRCQHTGNNSVIEEEFDRTKINDDALTDPSKVLVTLSEHLWSLLHEGYGWNRSPVPLPAAFHPLPTLGSLSKLYDKHGAVTLLFANHHLVFGSWSATEPSKPVVYHHGIRWRGATEFGLEESIPLLQRSFSILASPWPLTGRETT